MTSPDDLRDVERQRLHALVARDMATAQRLHADDYVLITPRGVALTKSAYLDAVSAGELAYRRFEPTSDIDVLMADGPIAVLRYESAIEVVSPDGTFAAQCWHTDCYRRDPNAGWQAVWSQATAIVP